MRPDGSFGPPKANKRESYRDGARDEALIIVAGDMFAAGLDTKEIAIRLVRPESTVLSALHVARERQLSDELR